MFSMRWTRRYPTSKEEQDYTASQGAANVALSLILSQPFSSSFLLPILYTNRAKRYNG